MALDTEKNLEELIVYEVFARAYGGFKNVEKDLERIKRLGVNTIWFMPIHPTGILHRKGSLGSPYAIRDYRSIDPALGSVEDFKKLVSKIHALGMKVLMDVVFNHMAADSVLLKDHPDWFIRDGNGPTRKVADWTDVIDFDFSNFELIEYLIDTLRFWITEYDVDGFRCDVAGLVPIAFWNRARAELSDLKKLLWISESKEPEMYQAFDLTYDYDSYDILRSHFEGKASLVDYVNQFEYQKKAFDGNVKLRFLENHDQERIAHYVAEEKLKAWTVFLLVQKGALLFYNGQEFALKEKPDIFNEYKLDFSQGDNEFQDFFASMIKLRERMPVMKYGNMDVLKNDSPNDSVSILRKMDRYFLLYIGNLEGKPHEIRVHFGDEFKDRYIHAFDHIQKSPHTFHVDERGESNFYVNDFLLLSSMI
jgi:glycosidase